ncbi:MAG: DNA polymerase III subunit alpha [Rhodothermales bacterium]
MCSIDFSHLHCHTQYSLLDGAARIKTLLKRASELEMTAVGITDHGNLFGVPEFYMTAKKVGVKPIIGCEFYVTPSGMGDKQDRTRYHQVLFAKNLQGYRNLIKLSSLSYTDGYYYKPRIDKEALLKHSEGLIATTCCLQGEVLQTILKRGEDEGRKAFKQYLDIFGDDYYIEVQDHAIPEQKQCNAVLLRWAKEFGVKVIATNDVHYVEQADSEAQDVLLCLQTGREFNDPTRMRFENDQFFLKSIPEMQHALSDLDPKVRDEALDTTREIVDKCDLEIPMGKLLMPHYPIPPEFNNDMDAYLRHLVLEGAKPRYGGLPQHVVERIDYELGIIKQMGFAGYFLITQDFTTAARDMGVSVGPGRGSAAGSAVAYCLGITNIDPLKYDLLFERFLNPERVSMPDIDIDFDDRGRGKVIDYVVQKYGRENVCQIITFGTMGARSVIRDVSRVLQIPLQEADRIAKLIPEGPKVNLDSAMKEVAEFKALTNDSNPQIRKLMQYAQVLEGSARHTGVHAAGVIIAPGDVSEYVPVSVSKSKGETVMTTQYDGKWVEDFGLLKMDFLGLKTLTVLADALKLIKENHGVEIDLDTIPLDDPKTYELFQRGDTVAIFQFESSGMREWMRKLKPNTINDLIAMNALYRPGPMDLIPNYIDRKHGREEVKHPHDMLSEILEPTYGIPVYQEQVMQMAQVMGGFTLGKADIMRRGMGKKKKSVVDAMYPEFVAGAKSQNVDEKVAEDVWEMMAKFSGYGFNKSHSAAYSVVAYQTAYLKAHYPPEFMAAAMTNEMSDTKKLAIVLEEARHLEIEVLPPSINHSSAYFTVEQGKVRYGLAAIKGVGLGAIEAIEKTRAKHGPFTSLFNFTKHLDLHAVNKKAVENLARAGALDVFEGHRGQFVSAVDDAMYYAQKTQADAARGQNSLFAMGDGAGFSSEPNLPMTEPWTRSAMLKEERELMGFYMSGHPLDAYAAEARAFSTASLGDAEALEKQYNADNAPGWGQKDTRPQQSFCGIITSVQHRTTKSGKPMGFAAIEDFRGQAELVCFSNAYDRVQQYLRPDEVVLVRGVPEVRGGNLKVVVNEIVPMWKVREQMVRSLVLRVQLGRDLRAELEQIRDLCDANRGNCKLYFDVEAPELPGGYQRIHSRAFVIEPTPELMRALNRTFGADNVLIESE